MYCLQQYSKQWKWYSAEHKKQRELYWTFHVPLATNFAEHWSQRMSGTCTGLSTLCLRNNACALKWDSCGRKKNCIRACACMHMYMYIFFFASGHCVGNAPVTSKSFTHMLEALSMSMRYSERVGVVLDFPHSDCICEPRYQGAMRHESSQHRRVCVFLPLIPFAQQVDRNWISMDLDALHILLLLSWDISKHLGSCFDEMFPFDDSRWTAECYMSPDWWSSVVSRTLPDLCVRMCCPWLCQNSLVEILHSGT